ncbi:phenylacetate--CoA ligase family protein [Streptomyces cyaneofuscatus]|uniref:phenylacetate--CoA ligase family protein n=1 Tax=Streptomyces cyaneofuscatus TaxID=66883 RepID=UPI0033AFF71F
MSHIEKDRSSRWSAFAHEVAAEVPAYARYLREHGIDPSAVRELGHARLPRMDKAAYIEAYPLVERCRSTSDMRMIATSSGSSGRSTLWPRALVDEGGASYPFERVIKGTFQADRKHTLAIICFPLGNWIGGIYTLECLQELARTGSLLTIATPGNNVSAVLRVVEELGAMAEQTVLLGYPPFIKDVIDAGRAQGIVWERLCMRLVFAGEVFSETWRDLVCSRSGITSPETSTAALYGTSDAGVLAFETPTTIGLRRSIDGVPGAGEEVFRSERLPMLMQYASELRHFEAEEGRLFLTTDGAVPLVRYTFGDSGGVADAAAMDARCRAAGIGVLRGDRSPFVWLFGRDLFALSLYGANVYPETVALALEAPDIRDHVTGKFVMEVDEGERPRLRVVVELAAEQSGDTPSATLVAKTVLAALRANNGEYMEYVPVAVQTPRADLRPPGDSEYFPTGVKHRYTRAPLPTLRGSADRRENQVERP